ncbi:hypothetical protein JHK85_056693 [Glycine max]|nr:hypothetical protein JHK85_056693 [Glycine max]
MYLAPIIPSCIRRWEHIWLRDVFFLWDLSNNATMRTQPPCFVRLESLKILKYLHVVISDEEFNRVTKYLLENSPMTRASLINA